MKMVLSFWKIVWRYLKILKIELSYDPRECGSDGKESARDAEDPGLIPGLRRSPVEGNSNPLQYLAWKIPWTEESGGVLHGIADSWTWLSNEHFQGNWKYIHK